MASGVFDPSSISQQAEYTLLGLSKRAPISVSALRMAISEKELKARKKGKMWLVEGREFIRWWKKP